MGRDTARASGRDQAKGMSPLEPRVHSLAGETRAGFVPDEKLYQDGLFW